MDIPPLAGKTAALSLGALPVSYALNQVSAFSQTLCVMLVSALILGLLFMTIYSLSHGEITYDPLYAVFVIFSFTSVVDLVIALQEDGILMGFMDFYTKEEKVPESWALLARVLRHEPPGVPPGKHPW